MMARASSARPPEKDSIWAAALQATAAVARQGGSSEADVLHALTDALRRLKMRGTVMLLREDGRLEVRSVALSRSLTTTMARLGGVPVVGYAFAAPDVGLLSQALQSRQAVFAPNNSEIVRQITPAHARSLIPRISRMLGDSPVIAAPLLSGERPLGVMTVTAPWISPEDQPMVAALADHVAIALEHVEAQEEMRPRSNASGM
jgi:GAF domain-containing protein